MAVPIIGAAFGAFIWAAIRWIAGKAVAIAGSFWGYLTGKTALTLAAIAIMITLTGAFWAGIAATLQGLAVLAPPEVSIALGWFAPENIDECSATLIAAKLSRFLFDFKMMTTRMRSL